MTAILLSAISAEAFINELGTLLSNIHVNIIRSEPAIRRWVSLGNLLEQLEADHIQIKSKYLLLSHIIPGTPFLKGEPPFQDFSLLIDVRNDFVHPKAQQEPPKYFQHFLNKGWLVSGKDEEVKFLGWMNRMKTPEIANWACKASLNIIRDILIKLQQVEDPYIKILSTHIGSFWSKAKI